MLKANNFDGDGCRKNIHRVGFSPKDEKIFFVCSNHLKKNSSSKTLKWGILHLFPCPGNP